MDNYTNSELGFNSLNTSELGFITFDKNGIVKSANKQACAFTDLTKSDLIGNSVWEKLNFYDPNTGKEVNLLNLIEVEKINLTNKPTILLLVSEKGNEYSVSIQVNDFEEGNILFKGYILSIENRTNYYSIKNNTADKDYMFSIATKNGKIAMWKYDLSTQLFKIDPFLKQLIEQPNLGTEQVNLDYLLEYININDKAKAKDEFFAFVEGKSYKYHSSFRVNTNNSGEEKWFLNTGIFSEWDLEGRPVSIVGYLQDITEIKRNEINIQKQKSLLRSTIESSSTGMMVINRSNEIILHNSRIKELWNIPPGAALKTKKDFEKYAQNIVTDYTHFRKAFTNNNFIFEHYNYEIKLKNGKYLDCQSGPQIMDDKTIGWIWSFNDITQRKLSEIEIRKAKDLAETANKTKSAFLANISHEIRTPLNAIIGFSEILEKKVTNAKLINYISSITQSGHTLLSLINEILDLSKLDAGKLNLQLNETSFKKLILEVTNVFKVQAEEKGLAFETIEKGVSHDLVLLDEIRLKQILINLIGNAIKFTSTGFVRIEYAVEKANNGKNKLNISVIDSGIGIEKDQLEHIFEDFKQHDDQDNRSYEGTGLGLSISKRLVRLMNGDLSVKSKVNEGSIFSIHIPEIQSVQKEIFLPEAILPNPDKIEFEPAKILLADDREIDRNLIKELLSSYNLELYEANNGKAAIEKTHTITPDLILLNIAMPDMNGFETAKRIRAFKWLKHIPIIAISAKVNKYNDLDKEEYFDYYLKKPIQLNQLITVISFYLKNKKRKSSIIPKKKIIIRAGKNQECFVNEFETRVIKLLHKIKKRHASSSIKALSSELYKLSDEFEIDAFRIFSEEINEDLKKFDFENLKKKLNLLTDFYSQSTKGVKTKN